MNLTLSDSLLGRQRSRQWSPLITQQYRLRHVHQITGLNFPHLPPHGAYYYTLHLTSMSAPFYTSVKCDSVNPKWPELDLKDLAYLSAAAIVLRVWRHNETTPHIVVSTWGVNLSGLIYLGNKIADIQPSFFAPSAVIFNIRGGYFTSCDVLCEEGAKSRPFVNLNIVNIGGVKTVCKKTAVSIAKSEARDSYNLDKLRKLHLLQLKIKNRSLDVQLIKEKIEVRCGLCDVQETSPREKCVSSPNVRYAPQLLTMKSVNKMLEERPTRMQRKEMEKLHNEIEIEQFRSKLLSQERDKKSSLIRRIKNKLKDLIEQNEKKQLDLMDDYYQLRREVEKLKDLKNKMSPTQEQLNSLSKQLYDCRRKLLQELLFIYPIKKISDKKYTIHDIYLPNSDILTDYSDTAISVALGYITHILLMASKFLQVPLRYQMTHFGSRSYITDHVVSPNMLLDRERDFPLFTKSKDKIHFTYAVWLLNKNIAQLRWLFFMHTSELKSTLPNLLSFLEGCERKGDLPLVTSSLGIKSNLDNIRLGEKPNESISNKYKWFLRSTERGPGLSEILAIPEAFINKQITSESFKNYAATKNSASIVIKEGVVDDAKDCDSNETIEQGTDLLDPSLDLTDLEGTSRVLDSGGDNLEGGDNSECEKSSDNAFGGGDEKSEVLETWMKNGTSSECCGSDGPCENFAEMSLNVVQSDSPLMARTDALLNTKSFNLVKSKPSL